ncbi:MAG: efflux RND transporter periplasmic adaptor subunit [Giesbergeria sp.]|uniref:efflux RND transporter periplasmic adaptor subunit n=1 Tax=Giesbergeria sp. TaxID=2818473 RepID=UPI0026216B75|nr:efflux RND transporter periplasmic adaptor subunit [Giesbergeria sp.]MDD2610911.1 efflux RND transporter periplasmic adaptor subunit [Giesbergeria sp.]
MPLCLLPSWPRPTYLGCLVLAALLAGCSRSAPPEEPVRAVKLLTVGQGAWESSLEYAGEVRARVESRLGFRVAGKLTERRVELGQRVRAGQLLAQLDPQDYRLAADAARAQLAAATTQRDLAAADFQRYAALKEQSFISGAELERRDTTLKAAQAALDQARAQLSSQGNQAAYTQLVADVAGVVTGIEAEVGQVLGAGTPVLRIAQDGARDVVFGVPEDKAAQIQPGQEVAVRGWSANVALVGRVREVAASADAATRTFQVKVAIDAASAPALGSTVYVTPQALSLKGTPALKLPTTALRQEGQATAVWVYDPATSTVRSQVIQVAAPDGNAVVVASGLEPGMQVVATGVHVLSPGQKVTVYKPKVPAASDSKAPGAINSVVSPSASAAATPSAR